MKVKKNKLEKQRPSTMSDFFRLNNSFRVEAFLVLSQQNK